MDLRETSLLSADSQHIDDAVYSRNQTTWPVGSSNLILNALPAQVRMELKPQLKPVLLPKARFLYQEEDRLDWIYFPETAVLSESKMLDDGRMVEIAVTGKEGAVGLPSLLSGSRLSATSVQVSQPGTAHRVDFQTVERVLRSNPAMNAGAKRFVENYIKHISQRSICNMFHPVRERLCTWLLMVQDRCGLKTLTLTQEQIARTLGVYRPTVSCVTSEMRDSRLINYTRGSVAIIDRRRIELAACSCYPALAA